MIETETTKVCRICNIEKPIGDFYKRAARCKECDHQILRDKRKAGHKPVPYTPPEIAANGDRICRRCGETKKISEFYGPNAKCKECYDAAYGNGFRCRSRSKRKWSEKRQETREASREKYAKEKAQSGTRTCRVCGQEKDRSEFYPNHARCKLCWKVQYGPREKELREAFKANNPKRWKWRTRRSWVKSKYGLDWNEYKKLLERSEGKCEICGVELETPHIDHCHTTGVVRGLLCNDCNLSIGYAKDSTAILGNAIEYLNRFNNST